MSFDMSKARHDLVADVTLYPTDQSGRSLPIVSGWHCLCKVSTDPDEPAWSGWPILDEVVLLPGESGRFGWMFFAGEHAASALMQAGKFYLWDGRIVGEAIPVF